MRSGRAKKSRENKGENGRQPGSLLSSLAIFSTSVPKISFSTISGPGTGYPGRSRRVRSQMKTAEIRLDGHVSKTDDSTLCLRSMPNPVFLESWSSDWRIKVYSFFSDFRFPSKPSAEEALFLCVFPASTRRIPVRVARASFHAHLALCTQSS